MIYCPRCKVEFGPGYESCPRCGEFKTPPQDRVAYLRRQAEEYAEQHVTRDEVRSYLIENGMCDVDADEALNAAFGSVALDNRRHGCLRMVIGGGMLLAGVVALATAALIGLNLDLAPVGSDKQMVRIGILGAACAAVGLIVLISGVWSASTGK